MIGGVLELAQENRSLHLVRGFACIRDQQEELGRIPLDDLVAVLLTAHQVTVTKPILSELMDRGIPVITCGQNYHPNGVMIPYGGHHRQAGILKEQITLSEPRRKRLWQQIVQAKITQQRDVLIHWKAPEAAQKQMTVLQKQVTSGDLENREAQAARLYWQTLMGACFRRDQDAPGVNACLNYGYAVVRAAAARAAVASGLTPALGIHHANIYNAFALVDDLMEPYRPAVDHLVRSIVQDVPSLSEISITPAVKKHLVTVLLHDCAGPAGITPLMNALHTMAVSFVAALGDRNAPLVIPTVLFPSEVS